MEAPVAGLRAVLAGRSDFSNTPNPVIATLSPLATACWMVSRRAFTASVAVFLSPNLGEIASIRSRLFISSLLRSPNGKSRPNSLASLEFATSDLLEIMRCRRAAQTSEQQKELCRYWYNVQFYNKRCQSPCGLKFNLPPLPARSPPGRLESTPSS